MSERTPLRTLDIYIAVLFAATVFAGGLGLSAAPVLLPLAGLLLTVALISITIRWAAASLGATAHSPNSRTHP